MDDLTKVLEVAKELAIKAGEEIMKVYEGEDFGVTYKADESPLTKADLAANNVIVPPLKEAFKDYAMLCEEEKDNKERLNNDYCFVIDPLDGTKEFIKRNGQFTVNIALSYKHESVMGVIYAPVTKDLYFASRGNGAFLQKYGEEPVRLKVSDETDIPKLRLVYSASHGDSYVEGLIKKYGFTETRSMGSSLKGCLIAENKADIYYRYKPTMEWDTAAMQCIVEEAGGMMRQSDGSLLLYNRENSVNEIGFYILNRPKNELDLEGIE